jgi:group I intron endonuclease
MSYGKVYKIKNLVNGKEYVGQTTSSVDQRFKMHCTEKRNRHISNAIRNYGKENFEIVVVAEASNQVELNDLERHYVLQFDTMYPKGYNHRAGGNQNGICSDELKRKISLAKKGKPNPKRLGEFVPEERRIRISRSLNGKQIKAVNLSTGEIKIYETAHSTKQDGFNPSNVVSICKGNSKRTHSKGWSFEYLTQNSMIIRAEVKE